jgi:deoxyribodipyrimidine photolyase
VLLDVIAETKASAVFFNNLYDPISLVRDQEIKEELAARNVLCQSYNSELLYQPWEVLNDDGAPFSTFDGFWNRQAGARRLFYFIFIVIAALLTLPPPFQPPANFAG